MFREDSAAGRGEDLISRFTCERNSIRKKVPPLSLMLDSNVTPLLLPQGQPREVGGQIPQPRGELSIGTLDPSVTHKTSFSSKGTLTFSKRIIKQKGM